MTTDKKLFPILVKFPPWLVRELDREAEALGIPRVAVILNELAKIFLAKKERRARRS